MLVVQFYPKHGSGEDSVNAAFHFNTLFFHRLLAFAGLHVLDTCRRLDESSTKVPKEARGKPEPQLRAMKRINSGSVRRRIRGDRDHRLLRHRHRHHREIPLRAGGRR